MAALALGGPLVATGLLLLMQRVEHWMLGDETPSERSDSPR
jgi:hypothetical protein